MSTIPQGQAAAVGKGNVAEVEKSCLAFPCWVGREYLPDCHKFFVKRY